MSAQSAGSQDPMAFTYDSNRSISRYGPFTYSHQDNVLFFPDGARRRLPWDQAQAVMTGGSIAAQQMQSSVPRGPLGSRLNSQPSRIDIQTSAAAQPYGPYNMSATVDPRRGSPSNQPTDGRRNTYTLPERQRQPTSQAAQRANTETSSVTRPTQRLPVSSAPASGSTDRQGVNDAGSLLSQLTVVDQKKVRSYFKPGRVFLTLWAEPAAASDRSGSVTTSINAFGEVVFSKARRFVVVKSFKSHCTAVHITTYGGQGVSKRGINPNDHAAVVLKGHRPEYLPGESTTKEPLHIIIEEQTESLDPASRIDFSRLYTIEYYIKLKTVGRIAPEDIGRLQEYVRMTMWKGQSSSSREEEDEEEEDGEEQVDGTKPRLSMRPDRKQSGHRSGPQAPTQNTPAPTPSSSIPQSSRDRADRSSRDTRQAAVAAERRRQEVDDEDEPSDNDDDYDEARYRQMVQHYTQRGWTQAQSE